MMQCPCAGSRDATMRLNAHLDWSAAPRHQMLRVVPKSLLARTRLQKIWDVFCLLQPTGTARRCISDLRGPDTAAENLGCIKLPAKAILGSPERSWTA